MNTLRSVFSILSVLMILAPSVIFADAAGDFQKGIEAYKQGKSSEAAKWVRKAADQGNAKAQFNLGLKYVFGEGVIKDEAESPTRLAFIPPCTVTSLVLVVSSDANSRNSVACVIYFSYVMFLMYL